MPYRDDLDAANARLEKSEHETAEARAKLADALCLCATKEKALRKARWRLRLDTLWKLVLSLMMTVILLIPVWRIYACATAPEPSGYVDYCTIEDCTDRDCVDPGCTMSCLYGVRPGANNDRTYGRFVTLEQAIAGARALECPLRVVKRAGQP